MKVFCVNVEAVQSQSTLVIITQALRRKQSLWSLSGEINDLIKNQTHVTLFFQGTKSSAHLCALLANMHSKVKIDCMEQEVYSFYYLSLPELKLTITAADNSTEHKIYNSCLGNRTKFC